MNFQNYRKVVHLALWFDNKIALAKVIKQSHHQGYWSDAGGKVEEFEHIEQALHRETREETGLDISQLGARLIDCFIYERRKIKTFLFELHLPSWWIPYLKHTEPHKQGPWKLFTLEQALQLKLMPSVKYYLKSLK